jgi:hypothetical protein
MGLEKAIKETIEYAKKFGCNLSIEEIEERLISNKIYSDEEIENQILNIKYQVSPTKNKYYKDKVQKAKNLAKLIEINFKDVLFLGITGSVAAGYPKKNDDIDLLIITKAYRLWITRLNLRLFIKKNKIPHRKFGRKEKKDEFCFNLWLDSSSLKLIKEKQNIKNAVDLILLKKLINRNNTYQSFIKENDWAIKYVANGYSKKVSSVKYPLSNIEISLFDKLINWLVFWPQYWYMKKRIKNEKIGLHKAFFHH